MPMLYRSHGCRDCGGGLGNGSGRCSQCDGTGVNPRINSAEPKCQACRGTGVCPTCDGSGIFPTPSDHKIQRLFE